MKHILTVGWVLFALELFVVGSMFFTKNMGDDAAGRGMARGFALLLGPVVLAAGALLLWGTRGGPKAVLVVGLLLVYIPVIYGAYGFVSGSFGKLDRALGRAQYGRFEDNTLNALGRAVTKADTAAVRALLAKSTPDWTARDRVGQTLLGHAIVKAIATYAKPESVEIVRMLLAAGAPATSNAIKPEMTQASVSEHDLVYHLYGVHNEAAIQVLDMVLAAGLSPDVVDEDSVPIYFSTYTILASLEVLAKHGADFSKLDPRQDRLHQNALMNALSMQQWDVATFFLQHGVSPDYTAPDGRSARTILAEIDQPGTQYYANDVQEHADFIAALSRVPKAK